jgi:hypothetical protein
MLTFEIISDLDQARALWSEFSYDQTLFDTWEFRHCFYKYFNFPIHFIVGKNDSGEKVGLLALQRNTNEGYLEFFGGSWMEDNKLFIKPGYEHEAQAFYSQINEPAHLIGINGGSDYEKGLVLDEYKYLLPISNYNSYQDYISDKFNKKTQQTYARKFRKIESLNPQMILNQDPDIEKLIDYNIQTFGEDSSFHSPYRKEIYRDMLSLPFNRYLLSIKINDQIEAVCLNIEYKGTMFYLNAGANNQQIPNLGSYIIMQAIDIAIKNKFNTFDALMISYNWKERWHFNKIPFNKFDYSYQPAS